MGWIAGKSLSTVFTVSGGGAVTFSVIEHSWKELVDKIDITSSGHAGVQATLAGILRGDGRVKCHLNDSNVPWLAATGVRAGNNGVFRFYVGSALFFTVPAMVLEVNYTSAVAGAVDWEGGVTLNSEAGTYAYPS